MRKEERKERRKRWRRWLPGVGLWRPDTTGGWWWLDLEEKGRRRWCGRRKTPNRGLGHRLGFSRTKREKRKVRKRKSDSLVEKESVSADKLLKIQIPSVLRKQLVDDWEYITQQEKLVKLPRSPNVDEILAKYLEYRSKKDGVMTNSVAEILNGLRCYFDKALPSMLLYKKERQQYQEAVTDNVSPSTIYGAEHFLRLFVKLQELLAYVNIEDDTLTELQQKLLDFLKRIKAPSSSQLTWGPKWSMVAASGKMIEHFIQLHVLLQSPILCDRGRLKC